MSILALGYYLVLSLQLEFFMVFRAHQLRRQHLQRPLAFDFGILFFLLECCDRENIFGAHEICAFDKVAVRDINFFFN